MANRDARASMDRMIRTADFKSHWFNAMNSDKPMKTVFAVCGLILGALAIYLAGFAVWFRSDSSEELAFMRFVDIFLGLLFGLATLLMLVSIRAKARHLWIWPIVVLAVVAGALISWHDGVYRLRTTLPPRYFAASRVRMTQSALIEYAKDCGHFPSEVQGLIALCRNPGEEKWKGPYIDEDQLIDPWGTPLQYRIVGERFEVWSAGKDKVSGTEDDVLLP